uniref:ATP synthase F0 subunit 6 n=1 Tax=Sacculina confragosa TaxID=238040 RepID=UPI002551F528|nr:ATP synthase F0 subunit 6 [Sacculina confragosa]WGU20860.1 ATP synthase F0 subunit 6 [Sacculina confragosa]
MNLFTQFDPMTSNSFMLFLLWGLVLNFNIFIIFGGFWQLKTEMEFLIGFIFTSLKGELFLLIKNDKKTQIYVVLSLFLLILNQNFMGLSPYYFPATAHIALTFPVSIWIIFSVNLISWVSSPVKVLMNLLPLGTPVSLILVMIVIETISDLIRPLTLSIRLAANLTAGHLILSIVSEAVNYLFLTILPGYLIYCMLLVLEVFVAIIQSYVFVLLIVLYSNK